jgi:hypothetical protein
MTRIWIILILCTFAFFSLKAQKEPRPMEVGITYAGSSSFGFTYRHQCNNGSWLRLRSVLGRGSFVSESFSNYNGTIERYQFAGGLRIGKEKRRPINDRLDFRIGMDIGLSYQYSKDDFPGSGPRKSVINRYSGGINGVFGLNFRLYQQFIIGFELLPGISYTYTEGGTETVDATGMTLEQEFNRSEVRANFGTSSILMSLVYRFP